MIAALYVATGGCYFGLPGVDPWDETRDARLYAGPHPVVAHPPCARWGRYWFGGPLLVAKGIPRKTLGDDGVCFAAALASVREWGGILEHPAGSHAWAKFGLKAPPRNGGWVRADMGGGWTCCVEQGHYGHRARKPTWLYAVRTERPALIWGPSNAPTGATKRSSKGGELEQLSKRECLATPLPFRDLLIGLAEMAGRGRT
jgi:hypothetical protein